MPTLMTKILGLPYLWGDLPDVHSTMAYTLAGRSIYLLFDDQDQVIGYNELWTRCSYPNSRGPTEATHRLKITQERL